MWISTSELLHLGHGACIDAVSAEIGHDLRIQRFTMVTKAVRLNATWAQIDGPSRP